MLLLAICTVLVARRLGGWRHWLARQCPASQDFSIDIARRCWGCAVRHDHAAESAQTFEITIDVASSRARCHGQRSGRPAR